MLPLTHLVGMLLWAEHNHEDKIRHFMRIKSRHALIVLVGALG